MKRLLLSAAAVVALAAGALTLTAFRHARDPEQAARFVHARVEKALAQIGATDAQRTRIDAIVDRLLADGGKLRASHDDVRAQLLAQWQSPNPDRARLHALVDARAAEMKAFADEVTDALVEVHDTLTPDQRAKLVELVKARHGGWHGRRGGEE